MARRLLLFALLAGGLTLPQAGAWAAGPPSVEATWVTEVTATSARLRTEINPQGTTTSYRFEYLTLAAYEANLAAAKDPFAGATKAPLGGSAPAGAGSAPTALSQHVAGLAPATLYRYRAVATNSAATTEGPVRSLGTEVASNVFALPDGRGWELVSPLDKNGGEIQAPEQIFGGGVFQAATDGQSLTYSSADSFAGGQGAPAGSQYIATRTAAGWSTQNITTALLAGSYGQEPDGVPYQLFSTDLARALLSNGQRCRTEVGQCPVANPPLPGSGALAGYRDYYLRGGGFASLLGAADLSHTALGPDQFEVTLAGASPDLSQLLLSSCAALTSDATEVPAPGGCDPIEQNLYEWSAGSGLALVNLLPGDAQGSPGASPAAPAGAVSGDGARVYWSRGGDLYLRQGAQSTQVDQAQGGGGAFQSASSDGRFAFFSKAGHLYRYDAEGETSIDLTPGGEVQGVLGAAADGSNVYYQGASALMSWSEAATTQVAPGAAAAAPSDYPPATGAARVSADGAHLLFLSTAELSPYESNGATEVFLYGPAPGGGPAQLTCVSCNPTGERPQGSSAIPAAIANGKAPTATHSYKPRALAANGNRVFFESADDLTPQDSNNESDVYQWEAQGVGDCTHEGGCVGLISSGRGDQAASFIDASADGSDAFFLTEDSLAFGDPGSYDLYDARIGGGFPAAANAISCEGDACQALPEAPEDPTPGTLVQNAGNPAPSFGKLTAKKPHKPHKKKHHKKNKHHQKQKHGGGK